MELKMQLPAFEPLQAVGAWLERAMARRRARHQALQLRTMSEYELRDLGIGRSEVPALLRGAAGDRKAQPGGTGS
ncbi:DUF1127 domain-containing protein [Variovorax guangxiensis]|uniref:DUF1127 domain-containing protein n=1 Tax=Variovorax guangxiensis TaxID=1775474 RepID=UPI002859FA0C|nr:DUF1127 domain-containing protein [Variovorax guangxiensis]MDR6854581.1 uncharacterized protein YjiS (DUF1127 family) [Variovorax guangxiensis]